MSPLDFWWSLFFVLLILGDICGGKSPPKIGKTYRSLQKRIEDELINFADTPCAVTRDDHQYPWWEVLLDEVSAVRKIEIETGNQTNLYRLHDLVVSVGNIDVAHNLTSDKVFSHNRVCIRVPGTFNSTKLELWCENDAAGQYLTLQLTKRCVYPSSCLRHRGNYLKLCKVTVWGNSITLQDINDEDYHEVEREKQKFHSSSVAFNGFPHLAKTSKEVKIQNIQLCAVHAENKEGNFNGPYYLIEFGYYFLVQRIRFIAKLQHLDSLSAKIKVYTVKEIIKEETEAKVQNSHSYCGSYVGEISKGETYEFSCLKPTPGFAGILDVIYDKHQIPFLSACDILFLGHKVVNVAKYKPTKQSSQRTESSPSYVVVDGIKPRKTYYKSEHIPHPQCMRTEADDDYPWWRVDLIKYHIVTAVYLSTGGTDRLHDIQIRVGDRDIYLETNKTLFTDNYICQDFTGHILYEFSLYVQCIDKILGRYVSIQVTKPCDHPLCKKKQYKSLSLCEVEVFGLPVDIYYYGNVAAGKHLLRNQHLVNYLIHFKEFKNLHNYGWLYINMKNASIVKNVVMYPRHLNISDMRINAQIRVGYGEIFFEAHEHWYVHHHLCYEGHLNISDLDFLEIYCDNPVIGSKVLIQYECEWPTQNQTPCNKLILFSHIDVWVYKIESTSELRERYKADESLNYGWNEENEIDIMATQLTPIYETDVPPLTCTHTLPGEDPFPWLKIAFPDVYRVTGLEFNNTQDDTHRRLHDVEIRIGYEDISEASPDEPFKGNRLCFATGNISLDKGLHVIECPTPIFGTFLTIQIVRPCTDPKECDMLEPNILHLCHVKLLGTSAGPKDINENLSIGRASVQSSTFESKIAMLANN